MVLWRLQHTGAPAAAKERTELRQLSPGGRCILLAAMPWVGDVFLESPPYGELGRLDYQADGSGAQCHVCGHFYRNLGLHAYYAHQLSADAYRERFGIARTASLAAPVYAEWHRRRAIDNNFAARLNQNRPAEKPNTTGVRLRLQTRLRFGEARRGRRLAREQAPCVGCGVPVEIAAGRQRSARCPACRAAIEAERAERERAYDRKLRKREAQESRAARVGVCRDCGVEVRPDLSKPIARLPQRCPACAHKRLRDRERPWRREWMRRRRARLRAQTQAS
jgi:hypothetical protein